MFILQIPGLSSSPPARVFGPSSSPERRMGFITLARSPETERIEREARAATLEGRVTTVVDAVTGTAAAVTAAATETGRIIQIPGGFLGERLGRFWYGH